MIEHILLVEDSHETAEELASLLRRMHLRVLIANDVHTALRILERNAIDLMLLDLRLESVRLEAIGPGAFAKHLDSPSFAWAIFETMATQSLKAFMQSEDPPDVRLSINVPARVFGDSRFPDDLLLWSQTYAFPPSRIVLELTESSLDLAPAERLGMSKARILGFELALDDFGSGASNIDRLAQLPFNEVKIDAWFITHAEQTGRDGRLLTDIASLCRQRRIRTIVEGVETAELLDLAIRNGFDIGQGYLFGRALTSEEAFALPRWREDILSIPSASSTSRACTAGPPEPILTDAERAMLNSLWQEPVSDGSHPPPDRKPLDPTSKRQPRHPTEPFCLVVEDDENVLDGIVDTLDADGHLCWKAESLEDCRWTLRNVDAIGVVFLDLCLPDGNGLEILEPLRTAQLGHRPGVVVLTAHGSPEIREHVEQAGAIYLDKPATALRIREAFRSALALYIARAGAPSR